VHTPETALLNGTTEHNPHNSVASPFVHFRQFVDDDLGCASYLVADPEAGEAVVVDPTYSIERYVEAAEDANVRIVRVLETHTHADHVSGHGRLALEHGIPVSIHPAAAPEYAHDTLEDGEAVAVGRCTLRCLHTPGHRPEHCCLLVGDRTLLTGDSLFVGDAARPDLPAEARSGAQELFRSLHRLLELPDDVAVYPGHLAGSLCGTGMSADPSSTIGAERRTNAALAHGEAIDFVNASAGNATPRPPTAASGSVRGRRSPSSTAGTAPSWTSGPPRRSRPVTLRAP
jgi:hydroxyacylglutathione hydrolase